MIYKTIKDMVEKNPDIDVSKLLDSISDTLNKEPNRLEEIVRDLVSLYLENKKNNQTIDSISTGFYYLFSQGLTWEKLNTYQVYKNLSRTTLVPFKDIKFIQVSSLLKDSLNDYLITELTNNLESLKSLFFKAFFHDLIDNKSLKKASTILNLPADQQNLKKLMQSTSSFGQMKHVCQEFDINPWIIINKPKNPEIETLWPTLVWNNENELEGYGKSKTSFREKEEFYENDIELWNNLHTENTSIIDIHSRIAFAAATLSSEHYYSKFLNNLNIQNINLECEDLSFNLAKKKTLKERLLEKGKLKILNKFDKKQSLKTNLIDVITSLPQKPDLISNKKAFLKQWLKGKENGINYTELLIAILQTQGKFAKKSNIFICYLPLKKDSLEQDALYWEKTKLSNYDNHTVNFGDFRSDVALRSYIYFLDYIKNKNINWLDKTPNNIDLISETIIKTMKLPMENSLVGLADKLGTIGQAFKNLPPEKKIETFLSVKNQWDMIWSDEQKKTHESGIINNIYKKESHIFNMLQSISTICIEEQIELPSSFFDESWQKIKSELSRFSEKSEQAKNVLLKFVELEMIRLDTELPKKDNVISNRLKKI